MPKKSLSFTIALTLILVSLIVYSASHASLMHHKQRPATLAQTLLELEASNGLRVQRHHYELIDSIINDVAVRVSAKVLGLRGLSAREAIQAVRKSHLGQDEVKAVFQITDKTLASRNFVHGVVFFASHTLEGQPLDDEVILAINAMQKTKSTTSHTGLAGFQPKTRRFLRENSEKMSHIQTHLHELFHFANCEVMSAIYKSVFSSLNIPLHTVTAPKHVFVRWSNGMESLNWETTSSHSYTDQQYIARLGIATSQIENGTFMRSLADSEDIAIEYMHLGNMYIERARQYVDKGKYASALIAYNKGTEMYDHATLANKRFPTALNNKAMAEFEISRLCSTMKRQVLAEKFIKRALKDMRRAISLYPDHNFKKNLETIAQHQEVQ